MLEVHDLKTHFSTEQGVVKAVDGVSFSVRPGEVLCLVGESGSGKSVASMSILGLIPNPPGRIVHGSIVFRPPAASGTPAIDDLVKASESQLQAVRGNRIAMIFQDPMTSLNPYMTIGGQLTEVLETHQDLERNEIHKRVIKMLSDVGIPDPAVRLRDYPHQLSGGMRQRVMIAMALLCEPDLLIADEPTTALDVTIQAQILELIRERKDDLNLGVILITHDLGVVARMADRVAVMYAGRIVEQGAVEAIFSRPRHPYTAALLRSIPRADRDVGRQDLPAIRGLPPLPIALPSGCPFHPRCEHAVEDCERDYPQERIYDGNSERLHVAACHVVFEDEPEATS